MNRDLLTGKESRWDPGPVDPPFPPIRLLDVQWAGRDTLVWLEGRSDRSVLVASSLSRGWHRDLTRSWKVAAHVGYGGGEFAATEDSVFFVEGPRLYRQALSGGPPVKLAEFDSPVTSPAVSPDGSLVALVAGGADRDRLLVLPSAGGSATVVRQGPDFLMQPRWHPDSRRLVWIEWDHPHMPWDESRTAWAKLEPGSPVRAIRIAGLSSPGVSSFQPTFSPDGRWLAVVADGSGWFNLSLYDLHNGALRYRLEEEAEHAVPAWGHGLRTYGWSSGGSLVVIRNAGARTTLSRWEPETGALQEIDGLEGWTDLRQLAVSAQGDGLALVASHPLHAHRLLVRHQGLWTTPVVSVPQTSSPDLDAGTPIQHLTFGSGDQACHGLFQRPDQDGGPWPLVVRLHGGPTSQYLAEYDDEVCRFLRRGYAVLSLNYRGSFGYGRRFRDQLRGGWGELEVEDVLTAADDLVRRGWADPARVVLAGGSAGGMTVLLALARHPGRFRAGICRYPVVDLETLNAATHRFENRYLESLIGPFPEYRDHYLARSPLQQAGRIRDPVAIFHGGADQVVPLPPVERLAVELQRQGVLCRLHVFRGEGHGWRRWETVREYWERVDSFLREVRTSGSNHETSDPVTLEAHGRGDSPPC
ncbi:MAG: prolyl oligopeptidase family serine peptidase [Acidobacteriota bacterium]